MHPFSSSELLALQTFSNKFIFPPSKQETRFIELVEGQALTSINKVAQKTASIFSESLQMWQKYRLSQHKKEPKHLPLLAFEEKEFERKSYCRIRCRHRNRNISEWISK
jgi:hypothetical protein